VAEYKSLTSGNGEAYEKKTFQNLQAYENKSKHVNGRNLRRQSSPSYKRRYYAHATRSQTIWREHARKMQWYSTLGTTVILGDFTLYNLRSENNSECSVLTEICITLKVVGYTGFQESMEAVPPRGTGYLVSYNAGSKLVLFNNTLRAHL